MNDAQARWTRFRLMSVVVVFVLVWGAVVWRAFELQYRQRDRLAKIAENEGHTTIRLDPVRGEVFDRSGEKLAVSLETDSIFADPGKLENADGAATKLSKALGLERKAMAQKLSGNESFTWIKRQASPDEVARVEALDLTGVGLVKESKRFYPNKLLAAHVLGFVGVDGRGLEGIERGCDEFLAGSPTLWRLQRDALGRTFLDREINAPEEIKGANITLTLDRRIQYIAEKALAQAVEKAGAKGGMALVIRPRTGEILASAVVPDFNPNIYGSYPTAQRRNRLLTDTFDPGSTFKVFIVASALEDGLIKPTDMFNCENGAFTIDRHIIHDHHPYGILPVSKIIKYSSNIGALKIGDKLGAARLHQYLTKFSFGQRTGIDFPGESVGLLRPHKSWSRLDAANVAFGQGVSVTGLQLTAAIAAIANDGLYMRPYIISKITDSEGHIVRKREPEIVRQVISAKTASQMREMLRLVVTEGGTGTKAEVPGYPSAGKTGTAQKIDRTTGTFSDRKYFASFVGFVPYQDPQLAIFVGLDEPWPDSFGGTVAAPAFREIAQQALPLLNVSPQNVEPENGGPLKAAQVKSQAATPAGTPIKTASLPAGPLSAFKAGMDLKGTAGLDKKNAAAAAVAANLDEDEAAEGVRVTMAEVMPDLVGLSMRRALALMADKDVKVDFKGSGHAVWQQPQPGQALKAGQQCQVKFEPQR